MNDRNALKALAAIAALAATAALAEPVAMITDLQGGVKAGDGAAPAILNSIESGDTIEVAEAASLVAVYFDSGKEYTFKGPATIRFDAAKPEVLAGGAPVSRDPLMGRVAGGGKIKPVGKVQAAVVMRGSSESAWIKLETMAGTNVIERKPVFEWQTPEQGLAFDFELTDEEGRLMLETKVQGNSFALPDSVKLEDGRTYTWLIGTRSRGGVKYTNASDFTIATADQRKEIEAVRPATDARVSDRVTYAAWLDQQLFHDEARKYWKQVAGMRSGDANLSQLAN